MIDIGADSSIDIGADSSYDGTRTEKGCEWNAKKGSGAA